MLKTGNFKVEFEAEGVKMETSIECLYRTEEWENNRDVRGCTHIQQATSKIANILCIRRCSVAIHKMYKIEPYKMV